MNEQKTIVLGRSNEDVFTLNFNNTPHVLICGGVGAGTTHLGKLIAQKCMSELNGKLFIVDKRREEFEEFESLGVDMLPNLEVAFLEKIRDQHDQRIEQLKTSHCKNIEEYNKKFPNEPITRIFILIHDVDHFLLDEEICSSMGTIIRICRSTGIHLIITAKDPHNLQSNHIHNIGIKFCGSGLDQERINKLMFKTSPAPQELHRWTFYYHMNGKEGYVAVGSFEEDRERAFIEDIEARERSKRNMVKQVAAEFLRAAVANGFTIGDLSEAIETLQDEAKNLKVLLNQFD
ncbi:MAG TPA: hypothetical protein VJ824_01475 [Bacillota bacterium]|nr:hypothetical protein [Bacillota bacterium]